MDCSNPLASCSHGHSFKYIKLFFKKTKLNNIDICRPLKTTLFSPCYLWNSRIHFFFISTVTVNYVTNSRLHPCSPSDHFPVLISLCDIPGPPGCKWCHFSEWLLQDKYFTPHLCEHLINFSQMSTHKFCRRQSTIFIIFVLQILHIRIENLKISAAWRRNRQTWNSVNSG